MALMEALGGKQSIHERTGDRFTMPVTVQRAFERYHSSDGRWSQSYDKNRKSTH
jgi:hypothetical protein